MSDYPRCKTCKWWDISAGVYPGEFGADTRADTSLYVGYCPVLSGKGDGEPDSGLIIEDCAQANQSSVSDNDAYTRPSFGCVHHEPKEES
jgi:hypothetical protein